MVGRAERGRRKVMWRRQVIKQVEEIELKKVPFTDRIDAMLLMNFRGSSNESDHLC